MKERGGSLDRHAEETLTNFCDLIGATMKIRAMRFSPVGGVIVVCLLAALSGEASAQDMPRGGSILSALEREVRGLVDAVSPSVVTIRSTCKHAAGNPNQGPSSLSVGSGIILDTTGRILTSARVVENSDEYWVETYDERIFPAILLGTSGDISVLQIEAARLSPARIGDAAQLDVGSFVAAVGNSYGFACGLAWGEVNGFRPDGTVQLSLGVSAGSSGGAIVDTRGNVVGLIKAKISEPFYLDAPNVPGQTGAPFVSRRIELPTSSVSLAIPINTALRLARNVSETGVGAPAYVGVYIEDLTGWQAEHFKTNEGVLIIGVVEGSPASRYGLSKGDIIRSVGTERVGSVSRFRQVIVQSQPGERLTFDILREGRPLKVSLEMARADMPDLNEPIDALPPSAARAIPVHPVNASRASAVVTSDAEGIPASAQQSRSETRSTSVSANTDARLFMLERMVDSLMREVETLRKGKSP